MVTRTKTQSTHARSRLERNKLTVALALSKGIVQMRSKATEISALMTSHSIASPPGSATKRCIKAVHKHRKPICILPERHTPQRLTLCGVVAARASLEYE
jgi:hypothetical protein